MAAKKFGKMKIDVLDNGTARATATVLDAAGLPARGTDGITTRWSASDPGVVINPDPADASGLSAIFGPATPPVLVTGFTVAIDGNLADGTPLAQGVSEPNNIVAGGPAGFKVDVA